MSKIQLPHAVTRLVPQRGVNDCAVACLAMYLRVDYEEALIAASKISRTFWDSGLSGPQIQRAALKLGDRTAWTKAYDIDDDTGILAVGYHDVSKTHVVLLVEGIIYDPNHNPVSRWDHSEWMSYYNAYPVSLLQTVEPIE